MAMRGGAASAKCAQNARIARVTCADFSFSTVFPALSKLASPLRTILFALSCSLKDLLFGLSRASPKDTCRGGDFAACTSEARVKISEAVLRNGAR